MQIGSTLIRDTFAEAFEMRYARMIITAVDEYWLDAAVNELTGYSASVIGCDAEAGTECRLDIDSTPDGRPGVAVLLFGRNASDLTAALVNRVGQCVMTCPTTAVFDGLPESETRVPLGKQLRYFGDGFQKSKLLNGRRYWRIPVMDGEFVVIDRIGTQKGVAGGNLIIEGTNQTTALAAARRAADAVRAAAGVISPFPGGVVRSGSKVGSNYKTLMASTSDAYCPTLRGRVESKIAPETHCVYEIVIDGIAEQSVADSMRSAIQAAVGDGVVAIGAGNYGGKLGKHHIALHDLMSTDASESNVQTG